MVPNKGKSVAYPRKPVRHQPDSAWLLILSLSTLQAGDDASGNAHEEKNREEPRPAQFDHAFLDVVDQAVR